MTKCVRLYSDGWTQVAKSSSGSWFKRTYEKTVYGYMWTRWEYIGKLTRTNRYIVTYENLNGNEITERQLKLSFSPDKSLPGEIYSYSHNFKLKDKRCVIGCKYRLPY